MFLQEIYWRHNSFFCECDSVDSIWNDFVKTIKGIKMILNFSISSFEKVFGIQDDKFITYLLLYMKYYLFLCSLLFIAIN